MFNEGNQIHNFMSSSGSGTAIIYGSGSDFLTSYGSGSGSTSQKVTVLTAPVPVPVPQHCPDPHQNVTNPQHCFEGTQFLVQLANCRYGGTRRRKKSRLCWITTEISWEKRELGVGGEKGAATYHPPPHIHTHTSPPPSPPMYRRWYP
jgi:hypothetical protein